EHRARGVVRAGRVPFAEPHLGLLERRPEGGVGLRGEDAVDEAARPAAGDAARPAPPDLAGQRERAGEIVLVAVELGQQHRGARPALAAGRQYVARREEEVARGRGVARPEGELAGEEVGGTDPDAVGVQGEQPLYRVARLGVAAGTDGGTRLEVEDVVLDRGV